MASGYGAPFRAKDAFQFPSITASALSRDSLKHTPTSASRKRRQGRFDRFCRTVHRQTLDAADGSLPSRPDEAKLRPYSGFLCGV